MLVGCICKDYFIEIDGKKEKIKNEKLIGVFSSRIADLTKKDFYSRVSIFHEIF